MKHPRSDHYRKLRFGQGNNVSSRSSIIVTWVCVKIERPLTIDNGGNNNHWRMTMATMTNELKWTAAAAAVATEKDEGEEEKKTSFRIGRRFFFAHDRPRYRIKLNLIRNWSHTSLATIEFVFLHLPLDEFGIPRSVCYSYTSTRCV